MLFSGALVVVLDVLFGDDECACSWVREIERLLTGTTIVVAFNGYGFAIILLDSRTILSIDMDLYSRSHQGAPLAGGVCYGTFVDAAYARVYSLFVRPCPEVTVCLNHVTVTDGRVLLIRLTPVVVSLRWVLEDVHQIDARRTPHRRN